MKHIYKSRTLALLLIFSMIHTMEETKPQHHEYDYLLLMGTLYRPAAQRINHVITLWKQGIRFKEIVMLGSERALDYQQEPISHFYDFYYQGPLSDIPQNEAEMLQRVYETTRLPEEMEKRKATFVKALDTSKNPENKPATTRDKINEWLRENPAPGSCLLISHKPYLDEQKKIIRAILPESFTIEAGGPNWNEENPANKNPDQIHDENIAI